VKIYLSKYILMIVAVLIVGAVESFAQISVTPPSDPFPRRRNDPEPEMPKAVSENLAKLQIKQSVKDHEELLERGDEALLLTEKIDYSLEKNGKFTSTDFQNLERLEKVVVKIRKELGGDSDGEDDEKLAKEISQNPDLTDAFKYLRSSTETLVSELKKTSRHSISVVAIQASNSVIKVARFLRLRK
jgi:hypothetical protein